jgi:peptidoglycan/xylan/chitin deacetylase (PgdA/CDA1 family)
MVEPGFEVASHGWRWIDYHEVSEVEEREHIRLAIAAIERSTGARPVGWYTGRISPDQPPPEPLGLPGDTPHHSQRRAAPHDAQ